MTRPLITNPVPVPPAPRALLTVDRAVAELRRGGMVVMLATDGSAALVQAAEGCAREGLMAMREMTGSEPLLAITGRRAAVLGLADAAVPVVELSLAGGFSARAVARLADPCFGGSDPVPAGLTVTPVAPVSAAGGAVALAKVARLLPAAVVAPLHGDAAALAASNGLFAVAVDDVLHYQQNSAHTLRQVSEARVPLLGAHDTRIVAFRPSDGGVEHLAIIIGEPDRDRPVLTRLHSECFTGDLLGSLRCDCGDQLRGAIAEIAQDGSGVLLYLAQEGRGIGLVNKLRAYQLQDQGFDTLDANGQLGFDDDERIYQPAAEMLRLLGVGKVRLLTNNPLKVEALRRHDIEVVERVPHVFPANDHNEAYLLTKATRGGHLF